LFCGVRVFALQGEATFQIERESERERLRLSAL